MTTECNEGTPTASQIKTPSSPRRYEGKQERMESLLGVATVLWLGRERPVFWGEML